MIRTLTALALAACSLFAASSASAEDAVAGSGPSGALLLGYGFHDGLGVGLGVRVGYTLPMKVYLGGTLMYHFGSSDVAVLYPGVEGGYDIEAGPVIVRPYLGIGDAIARYTGPTIAGFSPDSSSNFAIWPGATVMYPVTDKFFVGGDARFLIVSNYDTFTLSATGGMYF